MSRLPPLRAPHLAWLQEVDYRSKTFSCSQCGSEAYLAVIEPIKEAGMPDYRLDRGARSMAANSVLHTAPVSPSDRLRPRLPLDRLRSRHAHAGRRSHP